MLTHEGLDRGSEYRQLGARGGYDAHLAIVGDDGYRQLRHQQREPTFSSEPRLLAAMAIGDVAPDRHPIDDRAIGAADGIRLHFHPHHAAVRVEVTKLDGTRGAGA